MAYLFWSATVAGTALSANQRTGNTMTTAPSYGTTYCTVDVEKQYWDLSATLSATFCDKTDPDEPVGFVHVNQDLVVTVTVVLKGNIKRYLCETQLCVCLAFESCGSGPEGEFCETITLQGDCSPCKTDTFVFTFDLPAGTLVAGKCGKQYDICITLASKDCCGKYGFVFGSCKDFHITVLPASHEAE